MTVREAAEGKDGLRRELVRRAHLQAEGDPTYRIMEAIQAAYDGIVTKDWALAVEGLYEAADVAWRWVDMTEHPLDYPSPEEIERTDWQVIVRSNPGETLEVARETPLGLPEEQALEPRAAELPTATVEPALENEHWRMGWSLEAGVMVFWPKSA